MASIQKILNKRQQPTPQTPNSHPTLQAFCLQSTSLWAHNPPSVQFSSSLFPASLQTMQKCPIPLGFMLSPYPQASSPVLQMKAEKIPRCPSCKAYMNLHNRFVVNGNNFVCSICGKESPISLEYFCKLENGVRMDRDARPELCEGTYTAVYSEHLAPIAKMDCFVVMVDLSREAHTSQQLEYAVMAMKEVFQRPEFDDLAVFLFGYDINLSYYDLCGSEPQRIVVGLDGENPFQCFPYSLAQARGQLFEALDSLDQTAQHGNEKSEFFQSFSFVYEITKGYSPKYFILQASEYFQCQKFTNQTAIDKDKQNLHANKSILQPLNKDFFNKYISDMLQRGVCMSFFSFGATEKNMRVLADTFKLTNSELFRYRKNCPQDIMRFYYQLYSLLQAPYLQNFSLRINLSPGWLVQGIYSNLYRTKDALQCKFGRLSPQKCVAYHLSLHSKVQSPSRLCIQITTFHSQHSQYLVTVSTFIVPLTNSIPHLVESTNYPVLTALIEKIHLSLARIQSSVVVRSRFIKMVAHIYDVIEGSGGGFKNQAAGGFWRAMLAYLKSDHSYPDAYDKKEMDRMVSERNLLQCTGVQEINTYFTPYLFKISDMAPQSCTYDAQGNFIYPQTCQLLLGNISQGIFLMDCSTKLLLYVSSNHYQQQLDCLFGPNPLPKPTQPIQDLISNQNNELKQKLFALIGQLRSMKSYQYAPLYLVTWESPFEFFWRFTNEKHHCNRNLDVGLQDFMGLLEQHRSTL